MAADALPLLPIIHAWVDFGVRWLHVVAAISWIGASFYFVHLDLSLLKHPRLPQDAGGDAWQVHGGGFYHMTKYTVAPPHMPQDLTWFKWEAYTTFLSGFTLLCVQYYANPNLYLIDETVLTMSGAQAVGLSILCLFAGWLLYDALCRSYLGARDGALLGVFFLALVGAEYGLTKLFGGRGAFLQLGAMMGMVMGANVALVIIPNQRKVVGALLAGQTPDPALGKTAKQRSLHNNYLTLPVLFLMLSHHYPLAFATRYNVLIVALVLIMGALIRHFINCHHARAPAPSWVWPVVAVCALTLVALSLQGAYGRYGAEEETSGRLHFGQAQLAGGAPGNVDLAQVETIITSRCAMCHAKAPLWEGIIAPPQGVLLDTRDAIVRHRDGIAQNAVLTHAMPPGGNLTGLTEEERGVLARWLAAP